VAFHGAHRGEKTLLKRGRPSQIDDARGRSVTQLDPLVMRTLRRHDRIPAEALRDIAKEVSPIWAKWSRFVIIGCALLAVGVFAGYLYDQVTAPNYRGLRVGTVISCACQAAIALFWPCVVYYQTHRSTLERVIPAMLKHRRCPHCGYDIRGLPVAPEDRTTVCPECGCAWRIDDDEITELLAATSTGLSVKHKWIAVAIAVLLVALALAGLIAFLTMG